MAPRFTLWNRYSLRALFLLTTLCCVLLGLWSVYVEPFRRQARSIAAIQQYAAEVITEEADGPAWQRWLVTTMLT